MDKPEKERRTFYLPKALNQWLEEKAEKDSRSVSSYLNALLLRERNGKN